MMMRVRSLLLEALEPRRMLASDWNNAQLIRDVDRSGLVTSQDALVVVNELNAVGARHLPARGSDGAQPLCDVNADGWLSAVDALLIINAINSLSQQTPLVVGGLTSASDPNGNGVVLTNEISLSGQTLSGSNVRVTVDGSPVPGLESIQSDPSGRYAAQLTIADGYHVIGIEATDQLGRPARSSLDVRRGNTIQDWNAAVLTIVRQWTALSNDPYNNRIVPSQPPLVARNLAMIHTAMFNAASAADQHYAPYKLAIVPESNIDPRVAAAAAGFEVAKSLYPAPDEVAVWQATLDETLAQLPESELRTTSLSFGRLVGQAMLAERANDGVKGTSTYSPSSEVGHWQRTFPDYLPPLLTQWPGVKPFVLSSASEFRPASPPALGSIEYAEAVDEVMRMGGFESGQRSAEQTEIAMFWSDGGGTFTPAGHWNQIAADVTLARGTNIVDTSRAFALLNLAMADAGLAAWDAKYAYDLWRPIDAIRSADRDGNAATEANKDWIPLIKTPPFPTYTSGHSTFSGAASVVLAWLFDKVEFNSTSDAHNGPEQRPLDVSQTVTRHFDSFQQAAEEAGLSRIYGGIHFRFDNLAGLELGRQIGAATIARLAS